MNNSTVVVRDVVAAIHAVRSQLDLLPQQTEEQEVTLLLEQLKSLESKITEFDDLGVVKGLKTILLSQLTTSSALATTSSSLDEQDVSINVMRKKVFDIVRRDLIPLLNQHIQSSLALTADSETATSNQRDELLLNNTFSMTTSTSNKKQKSGYYSSFNFDDIPEYEPLEATLKLLRTNPCDEVALTKLLMEMELDDLVDHPQWRELLVIIRYSLYHETVPSRILSLQLHVRFATGLTEMQSADVVLNLLNYLMDTWVINGTDSKTPSVGTVSTTSTLPLAATAATAAGAAAATITAVSTSTHELVLDPVTSMLLSLFSSLLNIIPARILQSSMEIDGDRLIATVFILLARATVPITMKQSSGRMNLLDMLPLYTHEQGACISMIMAKRRPVAVLTHAVHSGLLVTLGNKLIEVQATEMYNQELAVTFLLSSRMLLSILLPFAANKTLMDFCCSMLRQSSSSSPSSSSSSSIALDEYLWDGSRVLRDDERFKEAWRTELLMSVGASSVAMTSDETVNRLMSHLTGAKPFVQKFLDTNEVAKGMMASSSTLMAANEGLGSLLLQMSTSVKAIVTNKACTVIDDLSSFIELLLRVVARSFGFIPDIITRQIVDDCVTCVVITAQDVVQGHTNACMMSKSLLTGLDVMLHHGTTVPGFVTFSIDRATTEIYMILDAVAVADPNTATTTHVSPIRDASVQQQLFVLWTHMMMIFPSETMDSTSISTIGFLRVVQDALAVCVGSAKHDDGHISSGQKTWNVSQNSQLQTSALDLLVAIMVHGHRHHSYIQQIESTPGLVSSMIATLTARLCVLCMEMYGGIVVPSSASGTHLGDDHAMVDELPSSTFTCPSSSSSSSMYRQEACLLVDVLLTSVRTWGEDAALTILSSSFEVSMVAILRQEELSERVWEASVSIPLGDEAPFIRLLGGLCQYQTYPSTLPSSSKLHRSVADRVISLCIASWQSLQSFCSDHGLLVHSVDGLVSLPPPPGSSFSVNNIDGITSRLLVTILQEQSIGTVEFDGIGPYVLRLLFCSLSNDIICMEVTQHGIETGSSSTPELTTKIATEEQHGNDVMGIFLHCLHTRINEPPLFKDCTELLLQ